MSGISFKMIFTDFMTDFLLFGPTLRAFFPKIGKSVIKSVKIVLKENGDIDQEIFMCDVSTRLVIPLGRFRLKI